MVKVIKPIGMVHLPGVNDKQYKKFIAKQTKQVKSNLWYQLP